MTADGAAVGRGPDDVRAAELLRENLLTVDEIAERAKVSTTTVSGWLHKGLLPSVLLPPGSGVQADAKTRAKVHGFRRGRQLLRVRETDWVRFVRRYLTSARG